MYQDLLLNGIHIDEARYFLGLGLHRYLRGNEVRILSEELPVMLRREHGAKNSLPGDGGGSGSREVASPLRGMSCLLTQQFQATSARTLDPAHHSVRSCRL